VFRELIVCVCLEDSEVLISCESSGCNVCLLTAGKPLSCYLQVVKSSLLEKEKAAGITAETY